MLLATCIIVPILPMLATPVANQYIETRMAMSFGSSLGILILFLVLVVEVHKHNIFKGLIILLIAFMTMLNAMYYIMAASENIATNYLDGNIAKTIIKEIDNYEKETNIKVENIGVTFDKNPTNHYDGQKWLGAITTRSMGTEWAAIETIELYSREYFNKVEVPNEYKEEFLQKDWDFFKEDQLIFVGNNLYICLY